MKYPDKRISYEFVRGRKVLLFFMAVGLSEPYLGEAREFYKYITRYLIAIIIDGKFEDHKTKAKAVDVLHLCEHIITSEEVRYHKPDRRILQYAIEQKGASYGSYG
ncbi:uncharacterized protein FTOL_01136 [Fusarium torulosum]|uniref:Uncharacterized protein n=1 Tax=Fusarium torulosum TaxID=33205 RepID=A0AAE8LZU4_9HYPO|nr:uncharacterized protein FTOL_01136 [Fusarium torulosum]